MLPITLYRSISSYFIYLYNLLRTFVPPNNLRACCKEIYTYVLRQCYYKKRIVLGNVKAVNQKYNPRFINFKSDLKR